MEAPHVPLSIAPEVRPLLRVAAIAAAGVRVEPAGEPLRAEIERISREIARSWAGRPPSEIEVLAPARRLYRAFGIDPTRTRPSSEALFRRLLAGKPFPEVSSAVDLCNLCSVRFPLPIGLYDAGKIEGDVTLRKGAPGEAYPGIRKDDVHVEGRPTLADRRGAFGNPTSDSARTCVDGSTGSLWMVIFAPADYPQGSLAEHAAFASEGMHRHLGARSTRIDV